MKKYLAILLFLSSCAIEGEVYRLQSRVNSWYNLLDGGAERLFAQNNTKALGAYLDSGDSPDFQNSLRAIRINEAIMSFDGEQTAHFFYNVLLKDLARFSYAEYISSLSPVEISEFVRNSPPSKPRITDNARRHYGFKSFEDGEILSYYRNISFPADYYPAVYDILAFLARYRVMDDFLRGDIEGSMTVFENIDSLKKSNRIPVRQQGERDQKQWDELKYRVHMESLTDRQFLDTLAVVLPEMDADVRIKTIDNIRNRFKEQ